MFFCWATQNGNRFWDFFYEFVAIKCGRTGQSESSSCSSRTCAFHYNALLTHVTFLWVKCIIGTVSKKGLLVPCSENLYVLCVCRMFSPGHSAKDTAKLRIIDLWDSFTSGWRMLGLGDCIWGCSLTPGTSKWFCCEDKSREGLLCLKCVQKA